MSAVLRFDEVDQFHYDSPPHPIQLNYMDAREELVKQNNCSTLLGVGSFGAVYDFKGKALKVCGAKNLEIDGYHSFLKIILDNSSNPYFPKVTKIIKYKAKDGIFFYGVEMERLYSLVETSNYDLEIIGEKLINDFSSAKASYAIGIDTGHIIAHLLRFSFGHDTFEKELKCPVLIDALRSIRIVKKAKGHYNDISENNLMIRRIPNWETFEHEYQLVITDPIS